MDGPGLLYGGVGLALAITMHVVGLFKSGNSRLLDALLGSVFHGVAPNTLSVPFLVIISAVFCFGLAFAVLDTAGTWRRVVLGVTAFVLVFAMVPTFAVWQIYFSPFLPVVALFWTWFCTMMYANHHVMPCEAGNHESRVSPTVKEGEIELETKKKVPTKPTVTKKSNDPDAKYKPGKSQTTKENTVDG